MEYEIQSLTPDLADDYFDSCQCTTYRAWNFCLEKAETYVVPVRPGSW